MPSTFRPDSNQFKSEAQKRYLSMREPYVASKFASATPPWQPLPERLNAPKPPSPDEAVKRRAAMNRQMNKVGQPLEPETMDPREQI
jgi:hypothetical protein